MEELIIQTVINGKEVRSVNARDLHKELKLRSDFSTWIKKELKIFIENIDYISFHKKMEANNATMIEYVVTLEVAKHLAMMQRTEKGMEIRNYFISVEEEYIKSLTNKTVPTMTPLELAQKANELYQIELEKKEKQLEHNRKVIESLKVINDAATGSNHSFYTVQEFCKIVTDVIDGTKLGRTTCYAIFRSMKFVMAKSTEPTQQAMTRKYLDYIKHDYGYMTVIYKHNANNLIKLMVKHLQNNPELNEALSYPLGDV